MKIDAATIDHNVVRLINELMIWDISDDEHTKTLSLGYIEGMKDLADASKEVLRA